MSDCGISWSDSYVWIRCDSTKGRGSRAVRINAAKHAYEREHKLTLTLDHKRYDEAPGFLHRSEFRYTKQEAPATDTKVRTNFVPRDVVNAHELTEKERAEFDYLDWPKIDAGEDSASFFRYYGQLYDLGEFIRGSISSDPNDPKILTMWDGHKADSYFSAVVVKYVNDGEQVVVGTAVS